MQFSQFVIDLIFTLMLLDGIICVIIVLAMIVQVYATYLSVTDIG